MGSYSYHHYPDPESFFNINPKPKEKSQTLFVKTVDLKEENIYQFNDVAGKTYKSILEIVRMLKRCGKIKDFKFLKNSDVKQQKRYY